MDEIPLRVTVVTPANIPDLRGRHATTLPHGMTLSFRIPEDGLADVDRARKLIDPMMSRALFIRLCAMRIAREICQHNDNYLQGKEIMRDSEYPNKAVAGTTD